MFAGSDPHTTRHATFGFQFPDGPMRSRIGVESDHAWRSIMSDCFVEETFGGGHIPAFTQQLLSIELFTKSAEKSCPLFR
jgi:hypothetical protein